MSSCLLCVLLYKTVHPAPRLSAVSGAQMAGQEKARSDSDVSGSWTPPD